MSVQATQNYDYLRRKNSSKGPLVSTSLARKPVRRDSERCSNGTVSSTMTMSTDRKSAATNITQPPAYSKKLVVQRRVPRGETDAPVDSASSADVAKKYVPTVFENYITHTEHRGTGKTVELALWDTAGQEEYDRLRPLSYPETDLLFVCFAIDCPNSLENVMDKASNASDTRGDHHVVDFSPVSDLRNKRTCIDLLKTQGLTPVTQAQGQAVAKRMGAIYTECSSKEMSGVHEIFETAVNIAVGEEWRGPETKGASTTSPGVGKKQKKRSQCKIL
ncbi:hypothetical protein B0A49_06186 [Cryomyces minteri]|uniref:GTP-binding protein rhoC n=1 Tax=Cryomyces minteri TaxID=331657 RepID=A0A4U0WP44_9PEZI|nr:hypothetical protein B0A49_08353 [Cryomyces minteri]TKA67689.1 hypothetical protein B0A49_06186 [Cryomyces minteri]